MPRNCNDENGTTINLEITELGNPVMGNLTFALSGKDRNTGTFKGRLKDEKLIGEYTFQSEGVESSREVAFKVDGDRLIEGYGELTDFRKGLAKFLEIASIESQKTRD